jgi:hypothetical protein
MCVMILPANAMRVRESTADDVNRRIDAELERRLRFYKEHPEQIGERLAKLDEEWDVERVLGTNASSLILAGIALGAFVDHRWLVIPAVVSAFLLQHALQGWCPPLPLIRRLGVRTAKEIERERQALKQLQADSGEGAQKEKSADASRDASDAMQPPGRRWMI